MDIQGLEAIIGKHIAGIISVRERQSGPYDQLVLLFDDDTHFEIFGSALGWAGQVFPGSRDAVMEALHPEGGSVAEIGGVDLSGD